jgi:glucosamine kinase
MVLLSRESSRRTPPVHAATELARAAMAADRGRATLRRFLLEGAAQARAVQNEEAVSEYFIGVDGGGTRTRAVVLNGAGEEIARAEGAAALADPGDPEAAAVPIAEVTRAAADAAGIPLPCDVLWAGIAGAGRETVRSSVEMAVDRLGVARRTCVGTDVEAAFHAAFRDRPGILLVAGTGSVAWGRNESGQQGRVGGWGTLLGDEGSGYAIGLESLRRVARDADGRGPETQLREAILSDLGLDGADALVSWTAEAGKGDIAALVPVVVDSSRRGDAVAGEILVKAVEELAGHVLTLLANLGPWSQPPRVALSGGLLGPGGPLRRAMEVTISEQRLPMVEESPDPALGAAWLAKEMGTAKAR